MAEFYVAYEKNGKPLLAIVIAPERPTALRFETRVSLHAAMDSLPHPWQLQGEIQGAVTDDWLERMAELGKMRSVPRSVDGIFSFGSIPHGGFGQRLERPKLEAHAGVSYG